MPTVTATSCWRRRPGRFGASAAQSSSGPAKATPRRLALSPIGEATANASSADARYTSVPVRSVRSSRGSSHSSSPQQATIDANVLT